MIYHDDPVKNTPKSENELIEKAQSLAGITLEELSNRLAIPLPENKIKAKGWVGNVIELFLGANSGVKSQPDFWHLGIELKTLPLNQFFQPQETTYVCTVPPLEQCLGLSWQQSKVFDKLKKVLWVPYQADDRIDFKKRQIAQPLLWQPSKQELFDLQIDFEELMNFIAHEGLDAVTAHMGTYLQIRPKAANSHVKRKAINAEGCMIVTVPRGFYLRKIFTQNIMNQCYII